MPTKTAAPAGLAVNNLPPLEAVTSPALTTAEAAHYLRRSPQRMREWSSRGNGPISPARVGGRLLWRVADIRRLLGEASA